MSANPHIDNRFGNPSPTNGIHLPNRSPSRVCAIDLGSKTVKIVVGSMTEGGVKTRLIAKRTLNLGRELQRNNQCIGEQKLAEIDQTLRDIKQQCEVQGIDTILAISTHAVRKAANREQLSALASTFGIHLDIADGRREARVGYLAATGGLPGKIVVEMGSNSLQIAWERTGRIETRLVGSGYEQAFDTFFRSSTNYRLARASYRAHLEEKLWGLPRHTDQIYALAANTAAGFVTQRAKQEVTNSALPAAALADKIRQLEQLSAAEYTGILVNTPKANKILPGLVLLDLMLEKTGHEDVFITAAELPVGLIVEHLS